MKWKPGNDIVRYKFRFLLNGQKMGFKPQGIHGIEFFRAQPINHQYWDDLMKITTWSNLAHLADIFLLDL